VSVFRKKGGAALVARAKGGVLLTARSLGESAPPPGEFVVRTAANTGLAGKGLTTAALTAYTGPSTITSPTTITRKLITTPLAFTAAAAGSVIRECKLAAEGYWLALNDEAAALLIEDCVLDAGGTNASNDSCVAGSNYILRRCDVTGSIDGLKGGWWTVIEDNYIHDMAALGADPHNDGIQCLGTSGGAGAPEGLGLIIRRNTIKMGVGATSCIILSTGSAPEIKDVLIEENLFSGGAYCVYGGYQEGVDTPSKVSNITIRNNRVSTAVYANGGSLGPFTSVDSPVVHTGNVWHESGVAID
jgi:hypothetical protein